MNIVLHLQLVSSHTCIGSESTVFGLSALHFDRSEQQLDCAELAHSKLDDYLL